MHSVLAIARVTLKDALRKKVFFTILFFAVLLTVVSGLLPSVTADEQIRQVTKICLMGIGFFGMVVAIFLSAPSLPDDISKKTIFSVLTKPTRRWELLAGKILGLAYVLAIMLVVMGTLSFIYIHFWAWKLGPDPSGLPRLDGRKPIYASTVEYNGLKLDVTGPMVDSKRAIVSGFDSVTYHFQGLRGERFRGDTAFVQVTVFCHGWTYDPNTREGTAAVQVGNPTTGELRTVVFGADNLRPQAHGFPRSLIDKSGALDVTLLKHLPAGSYSAMAGSVAVLAQPEGGYATNFIKALVLMFMQYMVLVFVAIAASTFLTSTVSIITALFIYFTGSLADILRAQALKLGSEANIFTMARHSHQAEAIGLPAFQWAVNVFLRYFYLGISVVFPNLSYYDPSAGVSANEYISYGTVFDGLWYGAVYSAAAFLIAWLVFRRKEVD